MHENEVWRPQNVKPSYLSDRAMPPGCGSSQPADIPLGAKDIGLAFVVTLPQTNMGPERGTYKDHYPFKGTCFRFHVSWGRVSV